MVSIEQLRHNLKFKWLLYYQQNRSWLGQVQVWGTYDGHRRPCSSFILATASNLSPELVEILPFIAELSKDPDQIVAALGLNFNPESELQSVTETICLEGESDVPAIADSNLVVESNGDTPPQGEISQVLEPEEVLSTPLESKNLSDWLDESCQGKGRPYTGAILSIVAIIASIAVVSIGLSR